MEPVKLLERLACTATRAVRHPIASAAYAVGLARGLASAAVHGVTVTGHDPDAGRVPGQPTAGVGVPEPQRVPKPMPEPRATEDQIVIEPGPPGESFATEPKAVSRESEHGGQAAGDAEIDDWIDQAMARGDDAEAARTEREEAGVEPLFDAGVAKAIRSESAMLQKGAERDPE
jgi:hypothetical protein